MIGKKIIYKKRRW